jgi:glutathione S-transferase
VLDELAIKYSAIGIAGLKERETLKELHPLYKVPVAVIDGEAIFESSAICTYFADLKPETKLVAKPGTLARAHHDQWVSFCLTEMEAWLWNSVVNTIILHEDFRIAEAPEQNTMMFKRSASVLEEHLTRHDFLVDDRFSVTDIIVGWCVNFARRQGHLGQYPALIGYVNRLLDRPHCTLAYD